MSQILKIKNTHKKDDYINGLYNKYIPNYDNNMAECSEITNYIRGYNFYADAHRYNLLKSDNIENKSIYPKYIVNNKNKEHRASKKIIQQKLLLR